MLIINLQNVRHDVKNDVMSLVFIHNCKNVCFYLIKYASLLTFA